MTLTSEKRRVAVILSGTGYQTGSEITEAVSTLIALSEAGADYHCFAPPHVLEDASKIARGVISSLKELRADGFDAVVFPGGYGAAKVLSTWAAAGSRASVDADVERIVRDFHASGKPIGAICIAPAMIALVLGKDGVELTLGAGGEAAAEVAKTGATHTSCPVTDYISDRDNKLLTTPAYMYDDAKPHEVFTGIRNMIRELVEMA